MRLFTALDISSDVRAALDALLRQLKPVARLQWSTLDNLHITTKFIGEWPTDGLSRLRQALSAVPRPGAIPIAVRGLGWFPNPHSPRVFFTGIDAPPALADLARATDAACASIGIPPETKKYTPHLTLARVREPDGLRELRKTVAELESADFGAFTATVFHLYESRPGPRGSTYTKLEDFPLL